MNLSDLNKYRQERWRITEDRAIESTVDLQEFLEEMRWCYVVPQKSVEFPSLQGAIFGGIEKRRTAARQAAFQMELRELWRTPAMKRMFVQIHVLGRSPMIVTRDICRRIARIYLPPVFASRSLRRNGFINSLEMEILEQLHRRGMSKRELRLALNLRGRDGMELESALRNLRKKLLVVQAGLDEHDLIIYHHTPSYLRITEKSMTKVQHRSTGEFLVELYARTVVADTRSGMKSFFKGILSPQTIDAALYNLLLQSHLKVDSELVINNKKAIVSRFYLNGNH